MGIAILSGVVASLERNTVPQNFQKWESHTPGTVTPTGLPDDASTPSRFIACVNRQDSAKRLKATLVGISRPIEVIASGNLEAIQQSDVVLLWCASPITIRISLV
jgi:pyrroline-5-carboxylate reductase